MDEFSEAAQEVAQLWRVYRTCKQMCFDRGYEVLDSEMEISLEEFKRQFVDANGNINRKGMSFHLRPSDAMIEKFQAGAPAAGKAGGGAKEDAELGTIYFEFNGDANVGIRQIRTFIHDVEEQKHHSGVFVSKIAATPTAKKLTATAFPRIIEVFTERDLLVNITRHELVPKHILLSREEKAKLLQRYRLKESQLPRIQIGDPVAKYLSLRRGQVVKIIRRSETAGRYASYRWVI